MNAAAASALDQLSIVLRAVATGAGARRDRAALAWAGVTPVRCGEDTLDQRLAQLDERFAPASWNELGDDEAEAAIAEVIDVHLELLQLMYATRVPVVSAGRR